MANSMPWSVRGIHPDIREQAVEAAHRSGLSVGQWLNQILAGSLDDDEPEEEEFSRGPRRVPARRSARPEEARLQALGSRLGRLGQRRTSTAAHRFAADEEGEGPVLDLLQEAVEAIERIEKRQVTSTPAGAKARSSAMEENLRAFEAKLDQLIKERNEAPAQSAEKAIEARLAGIMATLERMQSANSLPVLPATATAPARFAEEDPAFARTLAEIEARRRNLDADLTPRSRAQAAQAPDRPLYAESPDRPQYNDSAMTAPLSAMRADLAKMAARIDDMRHGAAPSDDVALVRRELAQVSAALEQISPQRLVGLVEHAVSGLAEKFERAPHAGLPMTLAEPIERVHEDVRAVLREVAASRGTDTLSREVSNIARRLDQISAATSPGQIEQLAGETAAIKALVSQALRQQPLEGLAHQIEALSRQVERFQNNPATYDDRALMDSIRDVSDRLERLDPRASFAGLENRLSAISNIESRLASVSGLEEKIGEIALGMKKLAKEAQPLPKLDTISERLERIDRALDNAKGTPLAGLDQLTARLDKIGSALDNAKGTPLAGLDQLTARLDEIGSALDKVSAAPAPRGAQDDALLGLMERLSQRMEQVSNPNTDTKALDHLQREIAGLAKRMDQVGNAPAGLDTIERAVSDLFAQFDQTRRDMQDMAQSAASRAAEEALKHGAPAQETQGDSLAAEGLLLIKRDLNDFKASANEAESRTRQTLEQVQSTLTLLMNRLGEAEDTSRRTPPVAKAGVQAATVQQDFVPERALSRKGPVASDDFDLPLEPGMEPGAAAPLAPITNEPINTTDPRANFIAAARRAAQAAAEKSQAALNEGKDAPKSGRPTMRLASDKDGNAASMLVKARRPILLGLAAIVFSMGALKVMQNRNHTPAPLASKPAAMQPETSGAAPVSPTIPAPLASDDHTGALGDGGAVHTSEMQPIPGVNAPSIGQPHFSTRTNKRGQRLSDTPSISQGDPATVGSIGNNAPIDTSTSALTALAGSSDLKGLETLRTAALGGNANAIFEVGARYADGRGVTRDPKLAARWFEQAAAQGFGPAQYRLGSLYREGNGLTKDSNLAFQWFDRAAAQGHVLAMHNAAVLLAEGVHGTPDYSGAALWFKRAAEHGVKDSQFNVAILYARGLGVSQNLSEAYTWFAIAALQGDKDAAQKRDDMGARLTKDQLASANARIKAFKPAKPNSAANEVGEWKMTAKRS